MKKALEEWVPLSCLMTTLQLLTDVWRSISGRDEIEKIFINFFLALNGPRQKRATACDNVGAYLR